MPTKSQREIEIEAQGDEALAFVDANFETRSEIEKRLARYARVLRIDGLALRWQAAKSAASEERIEALIVEERSKIR